jgi:hypothetical protein
VSITALTGSEEGAVCHKDGRISYERLKTSLKIIDFADAIP